MLEKGLVQIYTGDGKGKTTAGLGLALRAAGRGNKVLIYQFLKPASLELGERMAIEVCPLQITFKALDAEWNLSKSLGDPQQKQFASEQIHKACIELAGTAMERSYDVIILDELVFCVAEGLAKIEDVKRIIDDKAERVEIILTGRGATAELIELADLVSEIKKVKHPFDKGIGPRAGIEY